MRTAVYVIKRFVMVVVFLLAIQTTVEYVTGAPRSQYTAVVAGNEAIEVTQSLEDKLDFSKYSKQQVVATGYTAGYESTGKNPNHPAYGVTFSGVKVKRDLYSTIAADLTIFPLGTILFVPGYGYGVVADTGSAIKGNRLDLYYDSVQDVYTNWGKKTIDVYIVEKGNGTLSETQLSVLNEAEHMQVFREQIVGKIPK